jgi:acyl carrier protein
MLEVARLCINPTRTQTQGAVCWGIVDVANRVDVSARTCCPKPVQLDRRLRGNDPADEITILVSGLIGTTLSADASLMEAGLDSIGATELAQKLGSRLGIGLAPTLLFDHPSIATMASALRPCGMMTERDLLKAYGPSEEP